MKKFGKLICFILMFFCFVCTGQDVEIENVPFRFRENLSVIVGLTQDQQGYLWFADLLNGLFRYDGVSLINYNADRDGLSSNRLECITTDGKGTIWIGSFDQGLNRFEPETNSVTQYRHDSEDDTSIRSDAIRTLVFDNFGMLWIGTDRGVDKLDPNTGTITHMHTQDPDEEILGKEHIRAMYLDRSGILWIGSSSPFPNEQTVGGLFKFNIQEGTIHHYVHSDDANSLIDNKVRAIFEDSRGTLWVGTSGDGLHTLNREDGEFIRHKYDSNKPQTLSRPPIQSSIDHITFINEDSKGYIWIGTLAGGLSRYNPETSVTYRYSIDGKDSYQINSNSFWTCLKTRDQLLWMATWEPNSSSARLLKINSRPNTLNHVNTDGMGRVTAFAENQQGSLFLGSNLGLWKKEKNEELINIFRFENPDESSWKGLDIEVDEHENVWFASGWWGLYKYNNTSGEVHSYTHDSQNETSISSNAVGKILNIGNGQFLLGMENGLGIFNTNTSEFNPIKYIIKDSSKLDVEIGSLLKDTRGTIWIGTGVGIISLDLATLSFKDYDLGDGPATIQSIYEDSKKNLWVGTDGDGLHFYDASKDKFIYFIDQDGLLTESSKIWDMCEDHQQLLWLETSSGFVRLDSETGRSTLYGQSWGVNSDYYNTLGAFVSSSGEFFYGTRQGYFQVKPGELEVVNGNSSKPFIDKVLLDDQVLVPEENPILPKSLSETEEIHFNYRENNISFKVGNIDYLSSFGENRFQVYLMGYDHTWKNVSTGDLVSYYNIPPGDYIFQLRAFDLYGRKAEESLRIHIAVPWWRTWWAYLGYLILFIGLLFSVDRIQRRRVLTKERNRAREKELEQAREIEKAYTELKATQAQLIQSEKMASLGELTAGIAHEIQNPLNFVNNFSEVSTELLKEAEEEIEKGDLDGIKEIFTDLTKNLEKINLHGARASNIVKGMLAHSRESSGEKVPTDINALCDEFIRLAYHGLRAKDRDFNAAIELDLDRELPHVKVVPEDFGRVLLNLINNSFYAVHEKSTGQKVMGRMDYKPAVTVSTKKIGHQVEISVSDNGNGIPENVIDKIFQPFFTTKPTGSGTGLGLSLSYDIVKAHEGELEVESEEGKGTAFKIKLPVA